MGGVIVDAQSRDFFRCTIREQSETGARIEIPTNVAVPAKVYLVHLRDRMAYESDVIWYSGREAGLAIRRTLPIGELKGPEFAFLTKVWLEHVAG